MRGRTACDCSLHSHLDVWRSHFFLTGAVFLTALLARVPDQLISARSNRKCDEEEELTTFGQPVESANSRCGHFPYPSKE